MSERGSELIEESKLKFSRTRRYQKIRNISNRVKLVCGKASGLDDWELLPRQGAIRERLEHKEGISINFVRRVSFVVNFPTCLKLGRVNTHGNGVEWHKLCRYAR